MPSKDDDESDDMVGTTEDNGEFHSSQSTPTSGRVSPLSNGPGDTEDGDSPGSANNRYSNTSFGESKSSSALEVESDNALSESRNDYRVEEENKEAKIVAQPSTNDDCTPSVSSKNTEAKIVAQSFTNDDCTPSVSSENTEAKIVAKPSTNDDCTPSVSSKNTEAKIVAQPSTNDDSTPSVLSPLHRRCVSVDTVAKVPTNYGNRNSSPSTPITPDPAKVSIETAAPIESVKAAVSKFGGIVDWKAHRVHTKERRKVIEQELDKAEEEMPLCKQQCEAANEAKLQLLKQLESTKRLIEELKLNLERAQTEEQQAKQDSELAKLRVDEMEQGIADDSSFAAKAQLEVARARHAAAVSELESVKDELEQLRGDYDMLVAEKDTAEKKAEEALFASKQVEKSVESLTIELITLKQSLDSAHSAHLEAEEHRLGAVMAREQDNLNWEAELKQAEEELEKLNRQMNTTKEIKSKLAEAMALLRDLKTELAAYMESKLQDFGKEETFNVPVMEPEIKTRADVETAINAAKNELGEVKLKIDTAKKEVNILKVASASLRSQLERENRELHAIRKREGMASTAAASLETELNRIKSEINMVRAKEEEEREKLVELPIQLQKAEQEVENAKALARKAGDELKKAKDEAEEAKAGASERESKLRAVKKEIETAKTTERLALAALSALHASETNADEDSTNGITLSVEEYYELSKRAHEAEEQANARIVAAMSQIVIAKESERRSLNRLEEASRDVSQRKEALETALNKAEQAAKRKLSVEQELRKWRADHEKKRKLVESLLSLIKTNKDSKNHDSSGLSQNSPTKGTDAQEAIAGKKKKKPFFPRVMTFLGKKKSHSSKGE